MLQSHFLSLSARLSSLLSFRLVSLSSCLPISLSVCLSVCLPTLLTFSPVSPARLLICLPVSSACLPVCLPVSSPVYLSARLFLSLSLSLPVRLFSCFPVYPMSVRLSPCQSLGMSVHLSVFPSMCPPLYLSARLSACLSLCLPVCLSIHTLLARCLIVFYEFPWTRITAANQHFPAWSGTFSALR